MTYPVRHCVAVRSTSALIAVAVVAALAGCSTGTPKVASTAGPAALTLETWGSTQYANKQFRIYKTEFPTQSKGVSLKVTSAGQSDSDVVTQYRLALSSGKAVPDILELNYSDVAEFASAGLLANIGPELKPYLGNVSGAAKTLSQYHGKTIAVPYEVKEKLWFYRKDMFAAASIDPTKVKTQAEFIAAGKKLQAKYPQSYIWNIASNPQQYQWGMIMSGNGASYSTKSPTCQITVGSNAGVAKTFEAVKALRASGVVDVNVDDFTTAWQTGLADGTIASSLNASWFPPFLEQYAPKLKGKWGVTTWPEIGGAVGGSEAAGSVFVIPAKAKNKAAAVQFLASTLMTAKGAKPYALAESYIPNVVSLQSDPAITNNAYFGSSLLKAYKAADSGYKVFPYDPAFNSEQTVLSTALTNYLTSSDSSPKSALATAQQQLRSQLGCPYTAK